LEGGGVAFFWKRKFVFFGVGFGGGTRGIWEGEVGFEGEKTLFEGEKSFLRRIKVVLGSKKLLWGDEVVFEQRSHFLRRKVVFLG